MIEEYPARDRATQEEEEEEEVMKPAFLQGPFKVRGAWPVRATVALLRRIYALGYALGSRSVCALCTVALILYCPFRLREGRTSQVGQGVRFRSVGWVRVPSWRGWGRNSGKGFNNPVKKRGALRVRYTRTYTYAHTHTILRSRSFVPHFLQVLIALSTPVHPRLFGGSSCFTHC